MSAGKSNYIVIFKHDSQVYSAGTRIGALETPPPEGMTLEDKRVFFISYETDNENLCIYQIPKEEVMNAPLKIKEKKATSDEPS